MRRILLLIGLVVLMGCQDDTSQMMYLQGDAFGTTYHIKLFSTNNPNLKRGIDSVISATNSSVSTYMPDSDISKINRGDSTVVVDLFFKDVFELSKDVNKKTSGYFDPTIGVLRNAYGFGEAKPMTTIDSVTLDSLMQYVGFDKVRINPDRTVSKDHPQIYIDFNAVAKGAGIDQIGQYLDSEGISNYLIELGGEILAKGKNMETGELWTVGVESPESDLEERSYEAAVKLQNAGMASSGNYRKFRIDSITGKKYVHTINPLTGSAAMSDVTSATVIAPTCGEADAYATAFMALGMEKSKELLAHLKNIEAYLTYSDPTQNHAVFITEGFRKLMIKD